MPEIIKTVKIANRLGLHARPAALLVQEASKYSSQVEIEFDDLKVNAKSIMGVMMLAAGFGSELTLIANGNDSDAALAGIIGIIERKFDEE